MFGIRSRKNRFKSDANRHGHEMETYPGRSLEPDFLTRSFLWGDMIRKPILDISEGQKHITVKAEIPGIEAKDLDISISGRQLSIKGEKKQEKRSEGESYYRVERSYGSFNRTIELPSEVNPNKVIAAYKRGVLKIKLKKTRAFETKRVKVNSV